MIENTVISSLMSRKSIRKYKKRQPTDAEIETVVRAGQQAPFAAQLCSVLLSRDKDKYPWGAPIMFTICVDLHRMKIIMKKRGWEMITNDLSMLLFGMQDAALMAENMVVAAESLGMGSCFIGSAPYRAEKIKKEFSLPDCVFPMVDLVMGFPDEDPPPRPRYPMEFTLFENKYPDFSDEAIERAMEVMDEGYMKQGYYRGLGNRIPIESGEADKYTFKTYGWTEHISRKWGQWLKSPTSILKQLAACGFELRNLSDSVEDDGGW